MKKRHKLLFFYFLTTFFLCAGYGYCEEMSFFKRSDLSYCVKNAILPVFEAYRRVDEKQSLLKPADSVSEILRRLGEVDQVGRVEAHNLHLEVLSKSERSVAYDTVWAEIQRRDIQNQIELKKIIPNSGWFSIHIYGKDAVDSAFSIVQHATNDVKFQKDVLNSAYKFISTGDVEGYDYAMLYDRVMLNTTGKQKYGTQMVCVKNKWSLATVEDYESVDVMRKSIGIDEKINSYVNSFDGDPPCGK